jgi:ribose transport system ATP-binding protein
MTVAENLFMRDIAAPKNHLFLSWSRKRREAERTFARYGLVMDPEATIENVRPVERALLAIVRALEGLRDDAGEEPTLLVLDEPTVFLPKNEISLLFDFVRQIAASGSSVLFVSHDLEEVLRITDRVTVLRDGHVAGVVRTAETTPHDLVRLIIGHELQAMAPVGQVPVEQRRPVLGVRNLSTRWLDDITFELHAGEVLGVTGLVGSGYEDLVYAIFGAIPAAAGTLHVGDAQLPLLSMSPRKAMDQGLALVPGDRQRNGSIATLSAAENVNLPVLDAYFKGARLRQRDLDENARSLMTTFDVRPARPDLDYGSFSGGNQQKAMMAKWQQTVPKVLLMHEPTQGVDIGARQQIWTMIRGATERSATICASSDYEQLAAICDRVVVVARGRVAGVLTGDDVTKERIADYCLRSSAGAAHTVPLTGGLPTITES